MDDHASILPPNSTPLELDLEAVFAERLTKFRDVARMIPTLRDPWTCPAEYLPYLAWDRDVLLWRSDWPEERKRSVIAAAPEVHAQMGYVPGVIGAVRSLGYEARLVQWTERVPEGPAGTFSVTLVVNDQPAGSPPLGVADLDDVVVMIDRTKRLSQHFTFSLGAEHGPVLGLGATLHPRQRLDATVSAAGHATRAPLALAAVATARQRCVARMEAN